MKDIRVFSGGLDFDSDPRNVGQSDYLDAIGITTGTSAKGSLVNMFGNTEVPYDLPTGDNTCIGALRNIRENSIIYFVYNSLGNHSILEYYCETGVILPILAPFTTLSLTFTTNFLGFTLENKIHSSNIVDDILTWVDNNVSPRKINKKSARAFMDQLTPTADVFPYNNMIATGTLAQKLQFVEFIKYKPFRQPSISTGFDATRKTNYLRELMVQAKYRYIYDNNEYSRWSDGSYVTFPSPSENATGLYSDSTSNNFASVTVDTGHPNVKSIEIAFRFSNTGIWAKLDSPIRKYDQSNARLINDYTDYVYNFYNDGVLIEVADDFNNYDAVPQISKTQEIIDGNRQVFANNVEGYDNPELSVALSPINTEEDISSEQQSVPEVVEGSRTSTDISYWNMPYSTGGGTLYPRGSFYLPNTKPANIVKGSVISFIVNRSDEVNFNPGPGQYSNYYPVTYTITEDDLTNWPTNTINNLATTVQSISMAIGGTVVYSWPSPSSPIGKYIQIGGSRAYSTGEYVRLLTVQITPPSVKNMSYKKGAWHAFGIVYKDIEGRDGGVATNQASNVYVPYLPEIMAGDAINNQKAFVTSIQMEINHTPPEWAYEYEIVYALNNLQKYTQFLIKGAKTAYDPSTGNYSIDCTYIVDYITKQRVVTSVDFQFEPGDYLRFISNADKYVQQYIEVKVLAFDTTTNILTVSTYAPSQVTAGMTIPTEEGVLCELYAFKKQVTSENRPYFSIGETYSILNPGTAQRAHQGNTQNQTSTQPAVVSLNRGDCYIYKRYFNNIELDSVVESENYSDFYQSKNIDISSIYVVIPNGKTTRYEQGLRYGGRYFPNTNTNNLCQFNGEDYDTVSTRYGPINKIATVGFTLKVLQTKKNTSIYVDRNMIYNASGESQLTLIDKVLGNKNPSELDYGCEHPESVCVDDRQMYFYDANTGTFIQDSANGMYPVSDYKVKTYFRDISEKIKNANNIYVYSGVDNFNNYITVTFVDNNTQRIIADQTISYHPIDNRWKSKQHYTPEYYGSNAMVLVSFKDGALWKHNDPAAKRNNYYGDQYDMAVKFVANMDYPKVKVFSAIAINASDSFSSPTYDTVTGEYDIQVPATPTYPQGMKSRLLPSKFRWKEGVQYADYLRDGTTPNIATVEEALMGGRKLRGAILEQTIRNQSEDETTLYSVIVHSVNSELSK